MDQFLNFEVVNFPEIEKINFKKVHKNYLKVILINFFCFSVVLISISVFLIQKIVEKEVLEYSIYLYSFLILGILSYTIILILGFRKRKYAVRDKDISYKSGLLLKKTTTVPFSRIQHLEINERMFSRLFKLASLSVYTAGDSSDDLEIKGIEKKTAIQIKEFISSRING
ncbi:PH domain-containing protein [Tenacibaculum sp. nBUS_03]|uniref:PH domain-containing protein n=1 Tax=Tenacibaculum sp. nBUS_03 TaxID=3395320 RepID=UPI003EBD8B10